jgi:hypothetical protein
MLVEQCFYIQRDRPNGGHCLFRLLEEADRGVKLYIHPSHYVPDDTTAKQRLEEALAEYERGVAGI